MTRRYPSALKNLICRVDVTAFAAVMFALVAMFLLPAVHYVDLPWRVSVDFAKVGHPIPMRGADREDAIDVAVTRDGMIWVGLDRVRVEDLAGRIRERVKQGAERKVYIRADARSRYGVVTQVLDGVRAAGIENVGFLVDERKIVKE